MNTKPDGQHMTTQDEIEKQIDEFIDSYLPDTCTRKTSDGSKTDSPKANLKRLLTAHDKAIEASIRLEELESIDYGCEDTPENAAALELILDYATSTIDGRSLRSRIASLKQAQQSTKGETWATQVTETQ